MDGSARGTYPFGPHHDDAECGEAREGAGVFQTSAVPAAPALPAVDKACVGYDARKTKPVCSAGCDWRADEAKIEDIDEKPVQKYVQRRGDEEDVGARSHDPLRLQIFLRGFEVDVAQSAGNQPAKEERGLLCEDGVLSELQEEALGEPP